MFGCMSFFNVWLCEFVTRAPSVFSEALQLLTWCWNLSGFFSYVAQHPCRVTVMSKPEQATPARIHGALAISK
jgi:hypothetical protein